MGRQTLKKRADRRGNDSQAPVKIAKVRRAAIEAMNKALRAKFEKLEARLNTIQADNIRYYFQIGTEVADIKSDPGKYVGSDGTPGLELIEKALSTQAWTLRRCALFVSRYNAEELEELVALYNTETNFQLHWGHVNYLLTLPAREQRDKFAGLAIEKMWDPRTLHERIQKELGRGGGHGRKHKIPVTVEAQIKQIRDFSKQWMAKQAAVWNGPEVSFLANVLQAGRGQLNDTVLEYLKEARALMVQIADAAQHNAGMIERATEYVGGHVEAARQEKVGQRGGRRQARHIELPDAVDNTAAPGRSRVSA